MLGGFLNHKMYLRWSKFTASMLLGTFANGQGSCFEHLSCLSCFLFSDVSLSSFSLCIPDWLWDVETMTLLRDSQDSWFLLQLRIIHYGSGWMLLRNEFRSIRCPSWLWLIMNTRTFKKPKNSTLYVMSDSNTTGSASLRHWVVTCYCAPITL